MNASPSVLIVLILGVLMSPACYGTNIYEFKSATEFWTEEKLGMLKDLRESGDELVGVWNLPGGTVQFRVKRALIEDAQAKTQGARLATARYVAAIHFNRHLIPWYRKELQRLTGQRFETPEEWRDWFERNENYLVWSEEAGHLVVDEDAKRAGTPVDEYRKVRPLK